MASGSDGNGREGENAPRNLDSVLKANAAKSRASKAQYTPKDDLPF